MERVGCGLSFGGMAGDRSIDDKAEVLIVGGGIAGVEAALALRDMAGDRVSVELCDPRREFVFRPFAVGEPYGASRVFRYDLERFAERCGITFRAEGVVSVAPGQRVAQTRDGERLGYDFLVIAGGVRMLWSVPGAVTFWGVSDEGQVGDVISDLRAGALRRLVFTMPGARSWALPLYELALLGATELAKAGVTGTELTVVTPEDAPLKLFGRRAAEQMRDLLEERGISVVTGAHPVRFDGGRLRIAPGEDVAADAVISLPRLEGRRIGGVPHDAGGFVGVDEHCRVLGLSSIYAVGDVTNFPVKQGGIATQQADVAAESIAAAVGVEVDPRPFDPVLRGVLWTGREPRYFYSRPTGGRGEGSRLGSEPQVAGRYGKVMGRYLAPFVESLTAESPEGESPERKWRTGKSRPSHGSDRVVARRASAG
jgi:sulfide:quinone oxidoreductase